MKPAAYMLKTAFAVEQRDYIKATAYMKGASTISPGHGDEKRTESKSALNARGAVTIR